MNHDDPKLTAYALDSLSPGERAEIEVLLKEHPSAETEVNETRQVAGIMRQLFRAELSETLPQRRREMILQAATGKPVSLSTDRPANVVVPDASWWRRTAIWQAAAACAVFGFGVYAISVTLTDKSNSGKVAGQGGEIQVGVPPSGQGFASSIAHQPGMVTPPETNPGKAPSVAIAVPPNGKQILPTPKTSDIAGNLAPGVPLKPTKPTVVNPSGAELGVPSIGERASLGHRPPKGTQTLADTFIPKPPTFAATNPRVVLPTDSGDLTLTGDEASRYYATSDYLNARWREANSIREGNTYADLARHFRRDGGSTPKNVYRFVMIKCPFIKVDVEFAGEDGKPATWPLNPETPIRTVSRPVFEPEQER
jgi:hypothetical protein